MLFNFRLLPVEAIQLALEQDQRSKWLKQALNSTFSAPSHDWTRTLEAIALIESDL